MIDINWKPDKNSSRTLYRQIVDYIISEISSGNFAIGTKIPSQRKLAEIFEVNRSTIVEALDELKSRGLIEGNKGGGTTIVNNTWSLLSSKPELNWKNYIEGSIHKPNLHTIQMVNKLEYEENIIRLGTGEPGPDLFPRHMMNKVLNRCLNRITSLGYLEAKGLLELRQVISKYIKKYGIQVPPSSILIVSGALQALQLISLSLLPPGSKILVEDPSYLKSLHIFQSLGVNLTGLKMDGEGIIPGEIQKNGGKNAAKMLYTIPTFNNPTGIVMSEKRRMKILKCCGDLRIPIVEDDVYRELWIEKSPPMPLKSRDKNGNVLYLGSISKCLAPGFRIGWIAGAESVIERLADIKMQTDYGSSSISQMMLMEWISSGLYEEHLKEFRRKLRFRRDKTIEILKDNFKDIASWNIPQGGFYIWLKLNSNISINKLFQESIKEKILINPGSMYSFSNNQNLRISYSYALMNQMEMGLKKLSHIIRKLEKEQNSC
ncbi:PLP-dependent aminotransferase family protein [Clostridium kluyveri]|uniref:HTH-type transcriptional regulator NorG n=1 Tax=Clostridium kluyveri TaxID=1534 RepID=A0A1L5F8X6_CLOKL|nr:PLP-dependent aminotransferase family protein [Clostridium kluyveri]APM39476.1 GntR family transcriptional regulator [Clostridium kluyveri]